jgi:16S rRNA (guanine527-N7)-methyltransferase
LNKHEQFVELLLKWNKVHSLTNIKTKNGLMEYVKDSIYPKEFLCDFDTCLDIGSGAGFPAIPLAIEYPNKKFTLVEPLIKRVSFLNIVKCDLNLDNITIIDDRVENIQNQTFDLITSRAVMKINLIIDLSKDIIHDNSKFLLYKGENVKEELENIDKKYQLFTHNKINYIYI